MGKSRSTSSHSNASSSASDSNSDSNSESESDQQVGQQVELEAEPKKKKIHRRLPQRDPTPEGYQYSYFPPSSFNHSNLNTNSKKSLWLIKVPTGINPSSLDGQIINLPNSSSNPPSSSSSKPLATFKLPSSLEKSSKSKLEYHLHLSEMEVVKSEAQAGSAAAETQLITMAGGSKAAQAAERAQSRASGGLMNGGSRELHGFKVLLPTGERKGELKIASIPVTVHAHLTIAPPSTSTARAITADSGPGPEAESAAVQAAEAQGLEGKKRKREQPWERLAGYFHPSGSITKETPLKPNEKKPIPEVRVEESLNLEEPSSSKKSKKEKKDKKGKGKEAEKNSKPLR